MHRDLVACESHMVTFNLNSPSILFQRRCDTRTNQSTNVYKSLHYIEGYKERFNELECS